MSSLYASVLNETQRIFLKKKTAVLLILSVAVIVFAAVLNSALQSRLGITGAGYSDFPIAILQAFTNIFLPLFIFMTAADLFSGEQGQGTLKIVLLKPVTRFKVFASKLISMGIYIAVSLGLVFALSIMQAVITGEGGGILSGLGTSLTAYCTAFIPMMMLAIIGAFIAQFTKSSSGALTASIFIYIGAKLVSVLFPGISDLMVTSYTDWHLMWVGSLIPYSRILIIFMFILSYSIIFLAAGYCLFDRKEL